MRQLIICALAASWLVILASAAGAVDVIQLTDNSTHDNDPAISGSNVVWQSYDGHDYEIYLWDGATNPVPSISLAGLALLAGLVLGTAGWLLRRRRFAGT